MSNMLKDNRLPLAVSAVALASATYIGFVPLFQKSAQSADTGVSGSSGIDAFEERLAALETGLVENTGSAAADIPEGADNARLRQEIDLITRGLANQTGRISRLKGVVEGITDDSGQIVPARRVMDEVALAKRGLVNLTTRVNALSDRLENLDTAAADITRLQHQMANVDRAFARLAANANAAREERSALSEAIGSMPAAATPANATTGSGAPDLDQIEEKLDAILQQLGG